MDSRALECNCNCFAIIVVLFCTASIYYESPKIPSIRFLNPTTNQIHFQDYLHSTPISLVVWEGCGKIGIWVVTLFGVLQVGIPRIISILIRNHGDSLERQRYVSEYVLNAKRAIEL